MSDCGGYYCDEEHRHIDCLQALIERCPDAVRKEIERLQTVVQENQMTIERLQKQFGTCSVCGYVAWKDKDARTEFCQYCRLQEELRTAQSLLSLARTLEKKHRQQNRLMREALEQVHEWCLQDDQEIDADYIAGVLEQLNENEIKAEEYAGNEPLS